jgi:peptidoglycan biosynthesis protein MviN/MurJ (putative lipid II flippase)
MLLPQGIIAQSVATALFPTLAGLAAKEQWLELRRIFVLTLRHLLIIRTRRIRP